MKLGLIIGISIGAGLGLFGFFAIMDMISAQQLQFLSVKTEEFDLISMSMDSRYAVCNPSSFPTSFDKIYAQLYYKSTPLGDMTIWGTTIPSKEYEEVSGRITINGQSFLQMFLGSFSGSFSGQQSNFDKNDMSIYLKVEKSILGFIPYSYEKRLDSQNVNEIQKFFTNGLDGNWDCGVVVTDNYP